MYPHDSKYQANQLIISDPLKQQRNKMYSKSCVKRSPSKRPKIGFQDQLFLNAGQKYRRMLQWEHSAIPLTFYKQPFVIQIFVLSIFEWPFYTGFTVFQLFNRLLVYCKGGNFNIHIWAWFGYIICETREIRFYL